MVKNPPTMQETERDTGSIPELGRFPGGGHGNSLQYSCWRIPMDRGAGRATAHGVAKSRTRLSTKHSIVHLEEEILLDKIFLFLLHILSTNSSKQIKH